MGTQQLSQESGQKRQSELDKEKQNKDEAQVQVGLNQSQKQQSSSSDDVDFDPDDANQKFFNLSQVKPLDLKAQWLGNTHQVLNKFESKLCELKKQKQKMQIGFNKFAQNENQYKISSMRKINFHFDSKQIYREFMQKSRKTLQKLHPALIINILSYTQNNVFLGLAKVRRVSQIFNFIYHNQTILNYFSEKDFGQQNIPLQTQQKWCQRFTHFTATFLYYKQIKYTVLIPQNSIKEDLQNAVDFINEVYKRVFKVKTANIGYFHLINKFMHKHRVVQALQSLSFTDMAVTRKAAIVAFSNYLAFNPSSRKKQQITKTKYNQMITLVQDEDYRDSLVINSRISNFLQEDYGYQLSAFIDTLKQPSGVVMSEQPFFDIVVYHYHNDLKSFLVRGAPLDDFKIQLNGMQLQFSQDLQLCTLIYNIGGRQQVQMLIMQYMPTFQDGQFGHCLIYRGQFYYVLMIQPMYQNETI